MTNKNKRVNLVLQWDIQNHAVESDEIEDFAGELLDYMEMLYPHIERRVLRAYPQAQQSRRAPLHSHLQTAGFEVSQFYYVESQLVKDGERTLGARAGVSKRGSRAKAQPGDSDDSLYDNKFQEFDPADSVYVLIANDGEYADYLKGLRQAGADVFLCGREGCSDKLMQVVGRDHFIPYMRPYVVGMCAAQVGQLKGKPVSRSQFGALCTAAIARDFEEFPGHTGFSNRRPFASVLEHMRTTGIVDVRRSKDGQNRVTITMGEG